MSYVSLHFLLSYSFIIYNFNFHQNLSVSCSQESASQILLLSEQSDKHHFPSIPPFPSSVHQYPKTFQLLNTYSLTEHLNFTSQPKNPHQTAPSDPHALNLSYPEKASQEIIHQKTSPSTHLPLKLSLSIMNIFCSQSKCRHFTNHALYSFIHSFI